MIFLDTNICIYIINKRPPSVLQRFEQFKLGELGISSVVAAELSFGVAKSGSVRNKQALQMFLAPFSIEPFDEQAAWIYGELRSTLEKQGNLIGALDMMIAAHALCLNTTLVTNNTREFEKVPGLMLQNWV